MKTSEIKEILSENPYGFFTVSFIKKDGTKRTMNARLGVKKHLKGGVSTTKNYSNLLTVYDCTNKGYRNINLDKVYHIKANKKEYNFED